MRKRTSCGVALAATMFAVAVGSSPAAAAPCMSHVSGVPTPFPDIQTALTAADATGSAVSIDGGDCYLAAGLRVPGGVAVTGASDTRTILHPVGDIDITMRAVRSPLRGVNGFNISNLSIDGTSDTHNQGIGILVDGFTATSSDPAAVRGVAVYSLTGTGIELGGAGTQFGGAMIGSAAAPVDISGNYIYNLSNRDTSVNALGPDGIAFVGKNIRATANQISYLHARGSNGITAFTNSANDVISGNTIANTSTGVGLDNSSGAKDAKNITVSSNTIHNTCSGVLVYAQYTDSVLSNTIYNDRTGVEGDGSPIPRNNPICSSGIAPGGLPSGIALNDGNFMTVNGNYVNMGNDIASSDGVGIALTSTLLSPSPAGNSTAYNIVGATGAGNTVYNGAATISSYGTGPVFGNYAAANSLYYSLYGCAYAGIAHAGNNSDHSNCLP